MHDADGATRAFEAALAKKSDPETELLFGTMLVENKRGDRAGEHLKKGAAAVKGDPASLATYGRMLGGAHLLRRVRRDVQARVYKAIAAKQDAAEFYVRRGTCRHELADEPGATQDFEKAVSIQPDFAAAHCFNLGLSLIAQKKNLPGARELEKASEARRRYADRHVRGRVGQVGVRQALTPRSSTSDARDGGVVPSLR